MPTDFISSVSSTRPHLELLKALRVHYLCSPSSAEALVILSHALSSSRSTTHTTYG